MLEKNKEIINFKTAREFSSARHVLPLKHQTDSKQYQHFGRKIIYFGPETEKQHRELCFQLLLLCDLTELVP